MVDAHWRRSGSFFSIRLVQHVLRLTFASCLGSHLAQFALISPCTFLVVFFFTGACELFTIFVVVSAHIWFIPPNGKIIRQLNMPKVIRGEWIDHVREIRKLCKLLVLKTGFEILLKFRKFYFMAISKDFYQENLYLLLLQTCWVLNFGNRSISVSVSISYLNCWSHWPIVMLPAIRYNDYPVRTQIRL